jgi:hypothetical protein
VTNTLFQEQQWDHDDRVQPQLRVRGRELHPHGPQGGSQGQSQACQVSTWAEQNTNLMRRSLATLQRLWDYINRPQIYKYRNWE